MDGTIFKDLNVQTAIKGFKFLPKKINFLITLSLQFDAVSLRYLKLRQIDLTLIHSL